MLGAPGLLLPRQRGGLGVGRSLVVDGVLLGDGVVIADGDAAEVVSGGWYFATETARVLDLPGVVTPEQGATALGAARVGMRSPAEGS